MRGSHLEIQTEARTVFMENKQDVEKQATAALMESSISHDGPCSEKQPNTANSTSNATRSTPTQSTGSRNRCTPKVIIGIIGLLLVVWVLALGLGLGLGLRQDVVMKLSAVGAVAADHTACSELGRDILERGGSAVDAAIAALVCVGVRQPHSMGIGGGVYLAVYNKHPLTVDMYDGRETAPSAATYDFYLNKAFLYGNLSIAVPGEIPAYWKAHQKYGRLPWKDLFTPSIKMAADGHPLSYSTARALTEIRDRLNYTNDAFCEIFFHENGEAKKEGDIIRMPALAKTLQGIADQGPEYLYSSRSPAAISLSRDIQKLGGLVTLSDLENYKVVEDAPVTTSLGDNTVYTLTAPSGGPLLAAILNVLQGFHFTQDDLHNVTTQAAMLHKLVETFKFTYASRQKLADPAFFNVTQLITKLKSTAYADYLRNSIDAGKTYGTEHYTDTEGAPWQEEGTTHISVIGPDGDAVSATSTVNSYFGSLLVSKSTGIILNNEMGDFSTPKGPLLDRLMPTSLNYVEPGKRPLSSMAPFIIVDKDGNPRLVLGSAGGARITTVNAQVTARILWLNQSLEDAINAKRLHHQLFPNEISYEPEFPEDLLEELRLYGHQLRKYSSSYMAVVQAVSRDPCTGEIGAFSDPRKDAKAALLYRQSHQK